MSSHDRGKRSSGDSGTPIWLSDSPPPAASTAATATASTAASSSSSATVASSSAPAAAPVRRGDAPAASRRPTSGRRARTPQGYSGASSGAVSSSSASSSSLAVLESARRSSTLAPTGGDAAAAAAAPLVGSSGRRLSRPSYEDPLDRHAAPSIVSAAAAGRRAPGGYSAAAAAASSLLPSGGGGRAGVGGGGVSGPPRGGHYPHSAPQSRAVTPPQDNRASSPISFADGEGTLFAQGGGGGGCKDDVAAESYIPTMPTGRSLQFNCTQTWGDQHYIGMNGIELFDESGCLITLADAGRQVCGNPDSINVLPEYSDDPRVSRNLLNGANRTSDDRNVWLAPYSPGSDHTVTVDLGRRRALSMIRVWNYNKSRPHSSRGVKEMEVYFDDTLVFAGEIAQAPGVLAGSEEAAEIILFTLDEGITSRIDDFIAGQNAAWRVEDARQAALQTTSSRDAGSLAIDRPNTSHGLGDGMRPQTTAVGRPLPQAGRGGGGSSGLHPSMSLTMSCASFNQTMHSMDERDIPMGSEVRLTVLSNWGDVLHVGCGIVTLLSTPFCAVQRANVLRAVASHTVVAAAAAGAEEPAVFCPSATAQENAARLPQLLAAVFGAEPSPQDDDADILGQAPARQLGWYAGVGGGQPFTLTLTLKEKVKLCGVVLKNYNTTLAGTSRGIKHLKVEVDGKVVTPLETGAYIRKAPGHEGIDYAQTVSLSRNPKAVSTATVVGSTNDREVADALHRARLASKPFPRDFRARIGFEPVCFPVGHVFRLELSSTQGDQFYLGLNGLEMYDVRNQRIPLEPVNLQAVPKDITVLPQNRSDARVLDNLVARPEVPAAQNAWLAPFSPGTVNLLYVVFEDPVALSRLTLYNYAKTPARGAGQVTVYADDTMIYSATLRPAPAGDAPNPPQHMVFTSDPPDDVKLCDAIPALPSSGGDDAQAAGEGVVFYDSGKVCIFFFFSAFLPRRQDSSPKQISEFHFQDMPKTACRLPTEWNMVCVFCFYPRIDE